jgi:hypothetical protein
LKKVDQVIDLQPDPLLFWKENCSDYAMLAKLAKRLLAVPASSAAVERVFSQTGFILRPHRRTLNDLNAENLFFVKCNNEVFKWSLKDDDKKH